jgi:hypothetical protein
MKKTIIYLLLICSLFAITTTYSQIRFVLRGLLQLINQCERTTTRCILLETLPGDFC